MGLVGDDGVGLVEWDCSHRKGGYACRGFTAWLTSLRWSGEQTQ
jgi:hypothetical protein